MVDKYPSKLIADTDIDWGTRASNIDVDWDSMSKHGQAIFKLGFHAGTVFTAKLFASRLRRFIRVNNG